MRCYASTLMKCILSSSFVLVYTFFVFRQVSLNQVSVRQDVGATNNIRSTREIQEKTLLQNDLVKNSKASQRKVAAYKENVNNSQTFMNDLFISVKTTKPFHHTRLSVILRTWFILAREQTYIFSDADDPALSSKTKGHFINTNCSASHNRKALCCKMSVEFDTFLDSMKKWFCHFDDDNYVNVPQLLKMLQSYNPQEDWYLGKPSIRSPLEIISRDDKQKNISFWFATGGAGFCISRALALKMLPIASGGKFISIGEKIRLPDDVTMGYIIEHILKKKLTVVDKFHSHFEPMKFLKLESFPEQISFSYSRFGHEMNVLQIDGFDQRIDPTRFLSLHCYLFPNFSFCPS